MYRMCGLGWDGLLQKQDMWNWAVYGNRARFLVRCLMGFGVVKEDWWK